MVGVQASERALMQKMLEELKEQFDLTVERELQALQEANALRDRVNTLNEAMAAERAAHEQEAAQLRKQAEVMTAKAAHEEGLRHVMCI